MMSPSEDIPEKVTLIPAASTEILLSARVTVALVALPSTITTPSPGSADGTSGAGIVVVVVVVDVVDDVATSVLAGVFIPALPPDPEDDGATTPVAIVVVVLTTGSDARPFTVAVTDR